jgi:cytochrome c
MSDLRMNKIFGAVLATGLTILALKTVTEAAFHVEGPEKPGYKIEVQEETAEAAPAVEAVPDWGTVLPTADVAAGQTVSTKCAACHNFAAGGPNLTGPNLYGVIGRKPGSHAGFAYSPPMVEYGAANPTWDYDRLNAFLLAPQKDIAGTKMTFVGLKKVEERINLIAWLRTQAPSPPPIPAPKPAAAAPAAAEGAAPAAPAAPGQTEAPAAVAAPGNPTAQPNS